MTASEYSCLRQLRESGYKLKSGYTGSITILGNHVWIALAYFTGCTGLDCLINITKRTASRLRPNFLDVCRPVNFTTLCPDGSRDFVESYTCGRKTFADEFLSFPSGHSAYCAFASTFIIIYLHYRCKLPYKTRQLLQFLFATVAFTISLSRIRDNKHRLSDVIGGGFLGTNAANTDYYRQVTFELHKQYRQLVFDGNAPNKCGSLPKPSNYYTIQYDCDLENTAANWASQCVFSYSSGDVNKGAGELLAKTYIGSQTMDQVFVSAFTQRVLQPIITTGTGADATVTAYIGDWNQVAGAGGHLVGCSTQQCANDTQWAMTVCHYKTPGPYSGAVYEVGNGCTSDSDCDVVLQSTCSSGWCTAPPEVSQSTNDMCPSNSQMNDGARTQLLDWHNHFRSLVIQGNEKAGPNGTRISPSGKNMYKLSYNCSIEANAQAYASTCPFPVHSAPSARTGMGENMAQLGSTGDIAAAMIQAVQLFYAELEEYGIINLDNNTFTSGDMSAGHYSQVCWANTFQVGCGINVCSNGYHVVCQYYPAGNYLNQVIYPLGNPCTTDADCTAQAGDTCSTSDGLCVRA
ncbi:hypothetical protein FO519_004732 [Halicephalobus sp. NKZ332]|nr:hypothetical protein FO519_004732 [Halicephalobus sp. NKZ332]